MRETVNGKWSNPITVNAVSYSDERNTMYRWYNEDAEREKETVELISVSQALSYLIRFMWNESFKREEN